MRALKHKSDYGFLLFYISSLTILLFFNFLYPTLSYAASHVEHEHHLPGFFEFLFALKWFWINFVLFVALLSYLLKPPFIKAWANRRNNIKEGVHRANNALEQAEKRVLVVAQKYEGLSKYISILKENIKKEGEIEAKEMVEEAKRKSERILQRARESALAEQKSAELAMQHELTRLALKLARENFVKEMSPEEDKLIRKAALEGVKELVL